MNKRELARVLIRAIGVYVVASAVPNFVASLVTAWWTFCLTEAKFDTPREMAVRSLVQSLLQLAIGLCLFYRGGLLAKKLLRVDEAQDVEAGR